MAFQKQIYLLNHSVAELDKLSLKGYFLLWATSQLFLDKQVCYPYQLCSLLSSHWSGIVSLIPLPEGKTVNKDNAVLHQGLGSHQLVVGGVVDHICNPGLACAA